MLTDRSRCLLWVNNGHRGQLKECPLYPQKQTFQDGHDVRFVPKADIQLTVTSKIKPPDIARGFVVGTHGQSLEAWTVVEEIAETELDFADPLPDANSL